MQEGIKEDDIAPYRRALRGHLAERPAICQAPATLWRHCGAEYGASLQDTVDACIFLELRGDLHSVRDPLGGKTIFYQATAAGILAHERGE
jgi:asparagine synthetase B (glutamine-hydrolysing)